MADYRTFQIRLNVDKLGDVIDWLERQESYTAAIVDLVQEEIVRGQEPTPEPTTAAALDVGAIRALFDDALDTHAGHLRAVFDALLDQKLAHLDAGTKPAGTASPEVGNKIDAMF